MGYHFHFNKLIHASFSYVALNRDLSVQFHEPSYAAVTVILNFTAKQGGTDFRGKQSNGLQS